uniref:Reverse transcriptase domain-containing protein n=1 Tax=Tanacetum cinerariifolium TaxID=118510 RepID=A0A699RSV1_TANCI|nr:reverse transcriptase domain-containing protein [Tanacetum cinerariifolium]
MELWELKVKGTDLASYTKRFQELALLCGRMFFKEAEKIEKYVGGLPDMIHGSVVASKPKTMQEAIEIATELMDKKICTFAERIRQIPIMLTIRGALGQDRNQDVMSVEFKDTLEENVPS